MRSSDVSAGDIARIEQYNHLRDDAFASSWLLVHEQDTPDLTLHVENGVVYFGSDRVEYAGGNTGNFTAPVAFPRIDVLSISSAGSLVVTTGSESASPSAPALPSGNFPICQVYNRVGQTTILDTNDTVNGYIYKDIRSFLQQIKTPITTVYTSNDTWTKPAKGNAILVEVWGGGGSGGAGTGAGDSGSGGGGGAYASRIIPFSQLGATEAIVIGGGGASVALGNNGNNGNVSSFGTLIYAYGGSKGIQSNNIVGGGGGGGRASIGGIGTTGGIGGNGGGYVGGAGGNGGAGGDSTHGGGGGGGVNGVGGSSNGGNSIYGGGGGAGTDDTAEPGANGGNSIYGGGGGGGDGTATGGSGGTSIAGGAGGRGSNGIGAGVSGTIPAGGGGGSIGGNSGAGARGEIRVTEIF